MLSVMLFQCFDTVGWLGSRKGIRHIKTEWSGTDVVIHTYIKNIYKAHGIQKVTMCHGLNCNQVQTSAFSVFA